MRSKACIVAVLAGVAVRIAFAAALGDGTLFYYTQEFAASILPPAVPNSVFYITTDLLVLTFRVLPSLVIAVLVMGWMRPRSDEYTRCGVCKHILKGLSEPRCPECGESI